jgi:hypothetical protein
MRCGARTRSGGQCQRPAFKSVGRCRLHGGLSSGAKTVEGKNRLKEIHTVHGQYGKEVRQQRKLEAEVKRERLREIKGIEEWAIRKGILQKSWKKKFIKNSGLAD